MYPLVETIKIFNGEIYNLNYHQNRFERSYEICFNKKPFSSLQKAISIPDEFSQGLVKLRFIYGKDQYQLDFSPHRPSPINTLKVIEDNKIDYSLKFKNRSQINRLFEHRGDCDDILIVKNGFITDTSIANIIFYSGDEWITPATPLLRGTCREKLLTEGKIREAIIQIDDLHRFANFSLINAMNCGEFFPTPIENIY